MVREVNRNPRRWVDESDRVRVIEGWHPSEPDRVGYNLIVDGDWLGTFGSLDSAASAAAAHADLENDPVVLRSDASPLARGGRSTRARLHLVRESTDED